MPFWDAVYYENVDTQELGGVMLVGVGGGATTAVAAPAAAPYAYYYADKAYRFGQTPGGKVVGNALEGAAEGCLEAGCSPESVVSGAVEGTLLGSLETVGRPGRAKNVREVVGNEEDALLLFRELTQGLEVRPHPNPNIPGGLMADLPDGGTVGYRPFSDSGPPTIDINNVPGLQRRLKIKFKSE